jgi:EF-P beta-lysylation protein EpmB
MIPEPVAIRQSPPWQRELAQAVTDPAELLTLVGLGPEWLPAARAAAHLFPLKVPRGFVARMRHGDPNDPLLRQVLPLAAERESVPGFTADPVGDRAAMAAPGVLHKYHGRVLLTATGACAVHCRYCFRRHYPYGEANASADDWEGALAYLAGDTSVSEVILSGGDPLTLSDRRLARFVAGLERLVHVSRLRIHTRLPIVLPVRVDESLLDWMSATRKKVIVVVHANHPNELNAEVRAGLARLRQIGVELLNQSVLLSGVNDSVDVLARLSQALIEAGVLPYYLHLLDRVDGAAHFEVPATRARGLLAELTVQLPGYLVPRMVREVAGAPAKLPLCQESI